MELLEIKFHYLQDSSGKQVVGIVLFNSRYDNANCDTNRSHQGIHEHVGGINLFRSVRIIQFHSNTERDDVFVGSDSYVTTRDAKKDTTIHLK